MGLFLRKALSVGPIRLNISKSGLGISGGVKGARLSAGPSGVHVFAGRHGMYYRKSLNAKSTNTTSSSYQKSVPQAAGGNEVIVFGIIGILIISFMLKAYSSSYVFYGFITLALGAVAAYFAVIHKQKRKIEQYKQHLIAIFSSQGVLPSDEDKSMSLNLRETLPSSKRYKKIISELLIDVYRLVIQGALEAESITQDKTRLIRVAEQVLNLPSSNYLTVKKDVLNETYLEAIADQFISQEEDTRINNLIEGLQIPREEIKDELAILADIKNAQSLSDPLTSIPKSEVSFHTTRNESAFLFSTGEVYTRKKSKRTDDGYEYTQKRSGTLVVTSKRLVVIDNGTSTVKLNDIEDVEVDLDRKLLFISKVTSGKPVIIGFESPVYLGRMLDILTISN